MLDVIYLHFSTEFLKMFQEVHPKPPQLIMRFLYLRWIGFHLPHVFVLESLWIEYPLGVLKQQVILKAVIL